MRKSKYQVFLNDFTWENVNGYTFQCNTFNLGVHKSRYGWVVTELLTGNNLGMYFDTRKQAVEDAKKTMYEIGIPQMNKIIKNKIAWLSRKQEVLNKVINKEVLQ